MRQEWHHFVAAEPGARFAGLHARKSAGGRGFLRRAGWWLMGLGLMFAGFVMLFTPGPGILTLALGIACIAGESLAFARRCDRAELRWRERWIRWRKRR